MYKELYDEDDPNELFEYERFIDCREKYFKEFIKRGAFVAHWSKSEFTGECYSDPMYNFPTICVPKVKGEISRLTDRLQAPIVCRNEFKLIDQDPDAFEKEFKPFFVDIQLAEAIAMLNSKGYITEACCSGHVVNEKWFYYHSDTNTIDDFETSNSAFILVDEDTPYPESSAYSIDQSYIYFTNKKTCEKLVDLDLGNKWNLPVFDTSKETEDEHGLICSVSTEMKDKIGQWFIEYDFNTKTRFTLRCNLDRSLGPKHFKDANEWITRKISELP